VAAARAVSGRLVLVGGGHAHVRVLARWARRPPAGASLTLVLDRPRALYSGLVPAWVAGECDEDDLSLDAPALAERCGAEVRISAALRVATEARRIELADGAVLPWDVASLDIGSEARLGGLPGAERALATRPLPRLLAGVRELLARLPRAGAPARIAVVGAGAAGVELAFALEARLRREGLRPAVTLLEAGGALLPGHARGLARRVERHARRRGIELRLGAAVTAVDEAALRLASGPPLACDAVIWAAGPAAPPLPAASGLPLDADGFVRVRATLQVEGHDDLFAAGDVASLGPRPAALRSGVYAVRAGPVLADNLRARLEGKHLRAFRPQRDALVLLNLGDGTALGSKWGASFEGRWVRRWKERLDRGFVLRHAGGGAFADGGRRFR
jgi:selenide,water dikinase